MSYINSRRANITVASDRAPTVCVSVGSERKFAGCDKPGTTQSSPITIPDDGPGAASVPPLGTLSRKRKHEVIIISDGSDNGDAAGHANTASSRATPKAKHTKSRPKPKDTQDEPVEKRLRKFRARPPYSFQERLERAVTQRMFLINRERKLSANGMHEVEIFDIAGTTGNIYEVTISKEPDCTCPDAARRKNQCKHIIYVLVNILKAPEHLQYQQAFLSSELKEIFERAPVTPQSSDGSSEDTSHTGKRKPLENDCPVCVMEFKPGEEVLWCKAACGNNIHKACFEQWAKSKPGPVKCVYCRTIWQHDEQTSKKLSKQGRKNEEGYVNVASELGLSGERDHSSYHQPWLRHEVYGAFGGYY